MNLRQKLSGVLALLLVSAGAQATQIQAGYTVVANETDPGLVIQNMDIASNPFTFDLDPGDSVTFDLFKIWTNEGTVNGDDEDSMPIAVNFDFILPEVGASTVSGDTVGNSVLFGLYQEGMLTWNGPADFFYGPFNDGQIQIALSDEEFNEGGFGLNEGKRKGARVAATLTLINDATVAAPGTIAMFAIALLGLGFAARRRRSGFDSTI